MKSIEVAMTPRYMFRFTRHNYGLSLSWTVSTRDIRIIVVIITPSFCCALRLARARARVCVCVCVCVCVPS